ncbi:hypothetical protein RZS08_07735 [Arthrospira platensis SPKY1]|nr:hypothetical protein [Arthrospira platensis SPKY1]
MDTDLKKLTLVDEEHVTTTGLNLRTAPGAGNKVVMTMPRYTILWPQQKIPSWVQGKLVTQEGKPASDWIKVCVLQGGEEKTGFVTGFCWMGTASSPTVVSTVGG